MTEPALVSHGPVPDKKPPFFKRGWFIGVICGLVGFTLGAIGGASADPRESPEYKSMVETKNSALEDAVTALEQADEALAIAAEVEGDLPDREAALAAATEDLEERQADLKAAENAVAKTEKALTKREKAVGIVEKEIEANTVPGEGMYLAGKEIKPGTYRTNGNPGCYYAVLNSTDGFDIADNGNIDGPGFLTIRDGQYLEVTRCADWVLQ